MSNSSQSPGQPATPASVLRERAETLLRTSRADVSSMKNHDVLQLIYELQVHQIELQIQNEELRQAQMELTDSRDRFSNLYDFAPVGYLTLDQEGQIVEANLTAARLLAVDRNLLRGAKLASFVAGLSQDDYYRHRRAVFSSDAKQVCELTFQPIGGSPLAVRLESIALHIPQETQRKCHTALIDVTDRKQAEVALRQLTETLEQRVAAQTHEVKQLAGIVESSNDAIISMSPDGTIESWNNAAEQIFGYSRAEVLGKPISLLVPADGGDDERWILERIRLGEGIVGVESVRLDKAGRPINVSLTVSPVKDSSGRIVGASEIMRDISERKHAEQALRKSEEHLRAVLTTVTDAIVTIDQRGVIATVNPATESMFGYTTEELVGHNVSRLMPSPYADEHDSYIAQYLKTREARIIGVGRELTGRRKDGSTFPMDLAVSEVDHLNLFTGIIRDISERKELQKHVLEIAAEEQRRIGRELHDGTHQELTGLTLIAGTLRNALSSLPESTSKGRVVRLLNRELFERLRNIATSLCQNLTEVNQHVRDLSHGIMPVQIDAEGLRAALEGLATATDGLKGITCRFDCSGPVAVANNTTATHLFRIAQEAVNNSLRHSQADHIRISLLRQNGQLILEVSDNGVGCDPAAVGHSSAGGMGLRTMDYRAGMIGGVLQIECPEEGGTLVRCTVSGGGG